MQNATRTLAPIPMDDRLLHLALELKTAGLQWEPEVGYFVWDPQGLISHPSPFPKSIYFILSMKRFLKVFGDLEKMKTIWSGFPHGTRSGRSCGDWRLALGKEILQVAADMFESVN